MWRLGKIKYFYFVFRVEEIFTVQKSAHTLFNMCPMPEDHYPVTSMNDFIMA